MGSGNDVGVTRAYASILVFMAVGTLFGGCFGHGDAGPEATSSSTGSDSPCPGAPLVGHWRMLNPTSEDYYSDPFNRSDRSPYEYVSNQSSQNGSYQVVHEDHNERCEYGVVAALIFLKEEPGVATYTFDTPRTASVENDRAWSDRPSTFRVEFVDNLTSPP